MDAPAAARKRNAGVKSVMDPKRLAQQSPGQLSWAWRVIQPALQCCKREARAISCTSGQLELPLASSDLLRYLLTVGRR